MYNFDVKTMTDNVIAATRNFFATKGPNAKAVIGISGGVDSSATAAILAKAIGPENIIAVKLPCGKQKDIDYSNLLIETLGLKSYEVNIGKAYEALTEELRQCAVPGNIFPTEQYSTNTPARIRMTALYGIAALAGNGYPINTCNLSETAEGYDTIWGDSVGAYAPIARFTKSEVRAIAKYLGLPEKLYNKTPIDGMSVNEDGSYKSDEDKLGFTYAELDAYLREGKVGPNNDKIVNGIKKSAWKRKVINVEYFEPGLPFAAKDLW